MAYETQHMTRQLVRQGKLTPCEVDLANIEREWGDPKAARALQFAGGVWGLVYPWDWKEAPPTPTRQVITPPPPRW